ncbi:ABC transporter ATP-binding protein [Afifella sp. H1R]|uniref:ABC transporter ATP-binding protein n=1 Tax=unclassified Afifella TaxID=2624128 RepID=UPI001F48F273|nr:ABC transporter ATP-binding protein [Afifella sp. H1R]
MTDVLRIDDLSMHLETELGTVRAVENLSLRVDEGEAVALVGESGCGKSMTALSIMRLLPPYARFRSGSIRVAGKDLVTAPERAMRQIRGGTIGMIFQDPLTFLNPLRQVGEQIAEAVRLHTGAGRAEADAQALEALRRVRIADAENVVHNYPHQLSGGMRQRVLIAIAVACRPSLLICDEPTTALDVTIQAQIMELIDNLRHELGTAVLLITHDLGLVAQYCSRVYVMYAGQVVEDAKVREIFQHPRHPYTQALLQSSLRPDRVSEDFAVIEGQPPQLLAPPPGCRFHPRCPRAFDPCPSAMPGLDRAGEGRAKVRCHLQEAHQ